MQKILFSQTGMAYTITCTYNNLLVWKLNLKRIIKMSLTNYNDFDQQNAEMANDS